MNAEVIIECDGCPPDAADTAAAAVSAALSYEGADGDITVLITDDDGIWRLNREYRNIDRPTDVLSFPAAEGDALCAPPDGYLGDIVISYERALAQAGEYGHTVRRELSFLAIHGTLHVLGFDHMDEEEANAMFSEQELILKKMGIAR